MSKFSFAIELLLISTVYMIYRNPLFSLFVSRAILMYNVYMYCILYYLVLYIYCLLFGQINNNNNNNRSLIFFL